MSSFHALFSLGGMVGAAAVALLIGGGFGLGPAMAATAVLVLLLPLGALALGLHRDMARADVPAAAEGGWLRPSRAVVTIAALAFLTMLIEGAMADWSGVFMSEVTEVSTAAAATAYASFAVTMLLGRVFGDMIVRRLGAARVLRVGAVVVGTAVAVAVAIPLPNVARLCFAASGIGLSNLVPVLFSAGAGMTPDRPGDGVTGAAMGGYAGFMLGPLIIGLGAGAFGLRAALLVLVAAAAILASVAPKMVQRS